MAVVPAVTGAATPDPEIVATDVRLDVQVTWVVRSCTVPSSKMPVAVKAWVTESGIVGALGSIEIDVSVALETLSGAEPVTPENVAEMVTEPAASPLTTPGEVTGATAASVDAQEAEPVTSTFAPSE